jgi:arginase
MTEWVLIGVPTSAGAHHAGQDRAPAALRAAGLIERLSAAGLAITDAGDLPGAIFSADQAAPQGRNLPAVVKVAADVADAVAEVKAARRLPFVVGGDCTITIGAVAGAKRADPETGLIYFDGDADLGQPGDGGSGIFDSMGISHLLGRGAPELTGLGGAVPLLAADRLAILGCDPRETSDEGRRWLASLRVPLFEAPVFIPDPAATARQALAAVARPPAGTLVHFDVDVIDSGDLPLANFPHYGSGVRLEHAASCLATLCADATFAGLVLTEINPTHDPAGTELDRLIEALASALPAGAA